MSHGGDMVSIPKHKRTVDKELLATYRSMPCCVCGGRQEVAAHHVKTRGSGGGDVSSNLVPLCIKHHTEVHLIGAYTFVIKYPQVEHYLESKK